MAQIRARTGVPDHDRVPDSAYLQRIEYAADGYAALIHLPAYERAEVVGASITGTNTH
jgi:hypothetical protein